MFYALFYTLKTNKGATLTLLLALAALLGFTFHEIRQSRADLDGSYVLREDGTHSGASFRLDLESGTNGLNGLLRISEQEYLVTATQDQPGQAHGVYTVGEREIPFRLQADSFLRPFFYTLTSDRHRLALIRVAALEEDLSGAWVSLFGRLQVEKTAAGRGWQGLLTSRNDQRFMLEFTTSGLRLGGAYRHEGGIHPLTGTVKVAGVDQLAMRVAGQDYRFVRERSLDEFGLAHAELLPLFDGVFSGNGVTLSNSVRHIRRDNLNHWQCEGSFTSAGDERPIIGCGPEGERLWINYRSGGSDSPDFGIAYLEKVGEDVRLSGFRVNGLLKRVTPELTLGFYSNRRVTMELQQDPQNGDIHGQLDFANQRYRFRGEYEAGVLHAVGLAGNGDDIRFVVSQTPGGVKFTRPGDKPVTLEYRGIAPEGDRP